MGWSSAMDPRAPDSGGADRRQGAASDEREAAAAAAARSAVVSTTGASVYAPPTNEYASIALGVHMMLLCRRPSTAARSAGDGDTIATAACRPPAQAHGHTDNTSATTSSSSSSAASTGSTGALDVYVSRALVAKARSSTQRSGKCGAVVTGRIGAAEGRRKGGWAG